jgi:hypothetical protein
VKSILDPTFRYTPAAETDLRKTFSRIRREQRIAERSKPSEPAKVVQPVAFRRTA